MPEMLTFINCEPQRQYRARAPELEASSEDASDLSAYITDTDSDDDTSCDEMASLQRALVEHDICDFPSGETHIRISESDYFCIGLLRALQAVERCKVDHLRGLLTNTVSQHNNRKTSKVDKSLARRNACARTNQRKLLWRSWKPATNPCLLCAN